MQQQQTIFLDQIVTCNEKWLLYDNQWQPAQWLNREEVHKHFPKLNLPPPKKKVLVTGTLLLVWFTTAFWIPVKPWYLRRRLSKLMRCTKNCNTCSQHWPTERAQFSSRKHPTACLTANASELNKLAYKVLPHPPYSPDFLPTDCHFFKNLNYFLQEKVFHSKQEAANAFQEFVKSRSTDFYTRGINKLISRWQNCVDCNGSYFN